MVWQAIIIAIAVLLPAPVVNLARRISSGLASALGVAQIFQEGFAVRCFQSNFGEPDGGFHGFDLAEEGPDGVEVVMPPVLEKAGGFGYDLPIAWILAIAPQLHVVAQLLDDVVLFVLLLFGWKVPSLQPA